MDLKVFPDYKSLSRATADVIVEYVSSKRDALVCLASGHSPRGVFECLIQDVHANRINFDECTFISLDEWLGIPGSQRGSCRAMMDDDFFVPLQIPENQIIFFNGMAENPEEEVNRMNDLITSKGGLDIMLVGVGTNGHIAMNEPGTSFESVAHISTLAEETKVVGQKYFPSETELNKGITLGLKHFREAKLPILIANGEKKSAIISKVLSSPPATSLPASIVHLIPHGFIMLDETARNSVT